MIRTIIGRIYLKVQELLRARGWELARVQPEPGEHLGVVHYVLSHYVGKGERGLLVQVGANNGLRADPVQESIRELKIPALLIEPLPEEFEELKANYAGVEASVIFEHCAVAAEEGTRLLYRVKPDYTARDECPDYVAGLASFDRGVLLKAEKHLPGLSAHVEALEVPTRTLAGLLDKHGIDDVLMLQVDTEGYDYEVVKLALSAGITPRIINYEHKHLSPDDQRKCRLMLAERGYSFLNCRGEDTLAVRSG